MGDAEWKELEMFLGMTQVQTDKAWYRTVNFEKERVYRHYNDKNQGLLVRCMKDFI